MGGNQNDGTPKKDSTQDSLGGFQKPVDRDWRNRNTGLPFQPVRIAFGLFDYLAAANSGRTLLYRTRATECLEKLLERPARGIWAKGETVNAKHSIDDYLNALEVSINCKIEMAMMPQNVETEIKARVMTVHARALRIMAEFLEQNRTYTPSI